MGYIMKSAVTMIFFNRPDTLEKVFEKVRTAKPPKLFLVQDGARKGNSEDLEKIQKCRQIVDNVDWCCEVYKNYSDVNLGCGVRPQSGITWALSQVDSTIILEDDRVPDMSFFTYCDEMLERYKDDERICYISGLNHFEEWDFGGEHTRRISVSASFGCNELSEECQKIAKPLLKRFNAISVRENTGLDILAAMNITDAQVTADPTTLMTRENLLELCKENAVIEPKSVSKFILRKQSRQTKTLINTICSKYSNSIVNDIEMLSIPDWLTAIRDSKIVVTNSFHCVMMCLKLHTPFAVVLENGKAAGMNDRFTTLLNSFGLQERIITKVEEINELKLVIDFSAVDMNMEKYSESLKRFLKGNINNEQIQ